MKFSLNRNQHNQTKLIHVQYRYNKSPWDLNVIVVLFDLCYSKVICTDIVLGPPTLKKCCYICLLLQLNFLYAKSTVISYYATLPGVITYIQFSKSAMYVSMHMHNWDSFILAHTHTGNTSSNKQQFFTCTASHN